MGLKETLGHPALPCSHPSTSEFLRWCLTPGDALPAHIYSEERHQTRLWVHFVGINEHLLLVSFLLSNGKDMPGNLVGAR